MARESRFRVARLDGASDRSQFSSGSQPLDQYFRTQVTQDIRKLVAACYVALTHDDRIAGFYTLASASVPLHDFPGTVVQKLPRYPVVPTVRLGRLAVDESFKGVGLGGALLADALDRAARSEIAAFTMIVDAKDDTAVRFYEHPGFLRFANAVNQLFLPLATVRQLSRPTG